ncbi:MAG: flagellar biosynthetic protein FliR [Stagnimonas sp.]|nr:flagellar biosynthetic protein FliR [Stagnimonas sp.]
MHLTDTQLLTWLGAWFWPFIRIGAALMAAPVFGNRALPMRLRLALALVLTVSIAPALPPMPPLQLFGGDALLTLGQQLLIGIAIGVLLQLLFEAVLLGGELISLAMGLSFAQMADPLRGTSSPVLSSFLNLMAVLTFLALGGHLALLDWLVTSFRALPVGPTGLGAEAWRGLADEGSRLFAGGLMMALPALCALLLVNLGFGVMSRAAPSLNLMGVGFPISLTAGLVVLALSLGGIQQLFERMLTETATQASTLLAG